MAPPLCRRFVLDGMRMRAEPLGSHRGNPQDRPLSFGCETLGVARLSGECGRELAPRADLELAVDAREVELDGLHRDEELLGDLLVAAVAGRDLGNAALARGQRVEAAGEDLARPRAGR